MCNSVGHVSHERCCLCKLWDNSLHPLVAVVRLIILIFLHIITLGLILILCSIHYDIRCGANYGIRLLCKKLYMTHKNELFARPFIVKRHYYFDETYLEYNQARLASLNPESYLYKRNYIDKEHRAIFTQDVMTCSHTPLIHNAINHSEISNVKLIFDELKDVLDQSDCMALNPCVIKEISKVVKYSDTTKPLSERRLLILESARYLNELSKIAKESPAFFGKLLNGSDQRTQSLCKAINDFNGCVSVRDVGGCLRMRNALRSIYSEVGSSDELIAKVIHDSIQEFKASYLESLCQSGKFPKELMYVHQQLLFKPLRGDCDSIDWDVIMDKIRRLQQQNFDFSRSYHDFACLEDVQSREDLIDVYEVYQAHVFDICTEDIFRLINYNLTDKDLNPTVFMGNIVIKAITAQADMFGLNKNKNNNVLLSTNEFLNIYQQCKQSNEITDFGCTLLLTELGLMTKNPGFIIKYDPLLNYACSKREQCLLTTMLQHKLRDIDLLKLSNDRFGY